MSFSTRILLAYLLGGLCYPSRVLLAHRATRIRLGERLRGWANRLAWLFSLGTVDLYLVTRPVPLRRLARVRPVLSGRQSGLVSDYLAEVVLRRQGMSRQTYLTRVVVDLALMAVVISRHARAAAASVGSQEATADQVKEAIGIAELLFAHQGEAAQATVLQSLRLKLMSEEKEFRRLLAGEV